MILNYILSLEEVNVTCNILLCTQAVGVRIGQERYGCHEFRRAVG